MRFFFTIQWSVPEGTEEQIDTALDAIRAHVDELHKGISTVSVYRQYVGPEPHRAYRWMEEFPSLTALEAEPSFPECDVVWQPVRDIAIPGSFFQSIWTDSGGGGWLTR